MAVQRLYVVKQDDKQARLIQASSLSQARGHVAMSTIKAHAAKGLEIAELMQSGVKVEIAGPEPESSSQ